MVAFLASQGGNTVGPPVLEIAEFSLAEKLASSCLTMNTPSLASSYQAGSGRESRLGQSGE